MRTAGIVIDEWRLATFKRKLDAAGYSYTEHKGLVAGTVFLRVECDLVAPLQQVLQQAMRECMQ